ncbi:MAG TPA: PadR family transcriptional regulator [Bacillota bacterium]|nr:PadR family transcriptional regulator [Bacillota bacterium]
MSYIECMVLGLISQGYRYGHELDKVIEERNLRLWSKITRVSLYQALIRLKKKGWVATTTEREGKAPERNVYTLTESGRAALVKMVSESLASNEPMEFLISIPVSFLYLLPSDQAIAQLEKRQKTVAQILGKIPVVQEDDHFGRKANVKLIGGYYQMELQWLEWLISELKGNGESERKGLK